MFNILIRNKPKDNTADIKRAIVDGRDRGVCDSDGNTLTYHPNQAGKGDRNRSRRVLDVEDLCKRAAKNLWPRDKNGKLIGDN